MSETWDHPRLPKVKSTIHSYPKFIDPKKLVGYPLMSGANKFIGGTFRNTTLEQ